MERTKLEISREELFDVNMMITISVSVSGSAGHARLEAAFRNAVASFGILNTRIVIDRTGAAYYEAFDRPKSGLYYTERSLEDLIREQEKIRFRIEEGEYIRLFVDDREPGLLRLHFLMHHTGGDGKSLCYFIENFLRSLGGENLSERSLHLLTSDMFPDNSGLKPLYHFYVKSRNRKWAKEGRVFGIEELEKASESFWQGHETEILCSYITPEDLQAQLRECHDNGISYTSRYISELLKETSSEKRIGLAVSIRERDDRSMGNFAAGIQLKYSYDPETGVLENAKKIDAQLKEKRKDPRCLYFALQLMSGFAPSLVDAVVQESAGVFHSRFTGKLAEQLYYSEKSKNRNNISISNLGVLDIPLEYGRYQIKDLLFIPPNTGYARDVIGMVTVRGKLNMVRHRYKRKKNIAIITGASGGLGSAFADQLIGRTDEIWAIGRNKDKLQKLQGCYGGRIKPFSIDLSDIENLQPVSDRLKTGSYTVKYLINNAGSGRMAQSADFTAEEIRSHISTHNISPAVLCNICIPYMGKGSHILNIASQAAFQPLTYINLYAAGKAFCCSYSRALNVELKSRGITVTAVCPGWINTDLIKKEVNGQNVIFPHLAEPGDVAKQALRDAEKGKDMSVYSSYVRRLQFYSKVLPHSFVTKIWNRSVEKYIK